MSRGRGRRRREREQGPPPPEPRWKKVLGSLALAVLLVFGGYIIYQFVTTPATVPRSPLGSTPLQCLNFTKPVAVRNPTGWFTTFNVSVSYDCWQALQSSNCTRFTLTYKFDFPDDSTSPPLNVTVDVKAYLNATHQDLRPGDFVDFTQSPHWLAPQPPNRMSVTAGVCNG